MKAAPKFAVGDVVYDLIMLHWGKGTVYNVEKGSISVRFSITNGDVYYPERDFEDLITEAEYNSPLYEELK